MADLTRTSLLFSAADLNLTFLYPSHDDTRGREARRRPFIDVFVQSFAREKRLFIDPEMPLASFTHHGSCEYVLLSPTPPTVAMSIVEAKANDMDQGRAQVILQLVAAAVKNASHGFVPTCYFGVATTAESWVR